VADKTAVYQSVVLSDRL